MFRGESLLSKRCALQQQLGLNCSLASTTVAIAMCPLLFKSVLFHGAGTEPSVSHIARQAL